MSGPGGVRVAVNPLDGCVSARLFFSSPLPKADCEKPCDTNGQESHPLNDVLGNLKWGDLSTENLFGTRALLKQNQMRSPVQSGMNADYTVFCFA
jgi:hypothetical protein